MKRKIAIALVLTLILSLGLVVAPVVAATIDLAVNDENPWADGAFTFENILPGGDPMAFDFKLHNVGEAPGVLAFSMAVTENDMVGAPDPPMSADEFASLVYVEAVSYQFKWPADPEKQPEGYIGAVKDDLPNWLAIDEYLGNDDGKVSLYELCGASPIAYDTEDDPLDPTAEITYFIEFQLGDSLDGGVAGGAILTGVEDNSPIQGDGISVTITATLGDDTEVSSGNVFQAGLASVTIGENGYYTIQSAIDAADPGDTINVAAGIYEPFTVSAFTGPLTIKSQDVANPAIVKGSQVYGAVNTVIVVTDSTDISLIDLDIEGEGLEGGDPLTMPNAYAVIYEDATGEVKDCTISPNTAQFSTVEEWGYAHGGKGIGIWNDDNEAIASNVTVDSCAIKEFGCTGVTIADGAIATVKDSTIIGTVFDRVDWSVYQAGISVGSGSNILSVPCTATITGNEIYNVRNITDSTGSMCYGIILNAYKFYDISYPESVAYITGNDIHDNSVGVNANHASPANAYAHHNNIYDNSIDGVLTCSDNSGAFVVFDAINNWWGHDSGPYHPDSNPVGLGNRVRSFNASSWQTEGDHIDYAPWLTESYPPKPRGGGGGISKPPPGTTKVAGDVDSKGVFEVDVTATTRDKQCALIISEGTVGLTDGGYPLRRITMEEMDEPPPPPEGANVVGLPYDFGPDGATFSPPITLSWSYDPDTVPEGMDLVVAYWDGSEWRELENCGINTVTNTITADVSHFTAFAIIAHTPVVVVVPPVEVPEVVVPPIVVAPEEPAPPVVVAPAPPEPKTYPAEPAGRDLRWLIGVVVFCAIFFPIRWWRSRSKS